MGKEQKVVIITGGTRGIGLSTAKRFLEADNRVILLSNDDMETVKSALEELAEPNRVEYMPLDVSNEEMCKKTVETIYRKYGRIDVIANVAAIVDPLQPIFDIDMSIVRRVIDVDLMGSIYMALSAAKYMVAQGKGTIVNVGSVCSHVVTESNLGYHTAKSGLIMATAVLARELSPHGIRCVAVAPGFTRTRLFNAAAEQQLKGCQMKNRPIEPEEIAGAIYLLTTDEASAINGTMIMADDGFCSFDGMKLV